jgi:hypothetical protein
MLGKLKNRYDSLFLANLARPVPLSAVPARRKALIRFGKLKKQEVLLFAATLSRTRQRPDALRLHQGDARGAEPFQ